MATLELAENIIDAVVDKLTDHLPARVEQINQEKADGILVAQPAVILKQGVSELPAMPALLVAEGPTDFHREVFAEGPHTLNTVTQVGVVCYDQDASPATLRARLDRMGRAVIEAIWDDDPKEALTGSAHRITPIRIEPGRLFDPDQTTNLYRTWYTVIFEATHFEE